MGLEICHDLMMQSKNSKESQASAGCFSKGWLTSPLIICLNSHWNCRQLFQNHRAIKWQEAIYLPIGLEAQGYCLQRGQRELEGDRLWAQEGSDTELCRVGLQEAETREGSLENCFGIECVWYFGEMLVINVAGFSIRDKKSNLYNPCNFSVKIFPLCCKLPIILENKFLLLIFKIQMYAAAFIPPKSALFSISIPL